MSKLDTLWGDWNNTSSQTQQKVEREWDKPQKGEQRGGKDVILIGSPDDSLEACTHPDRSAPYLTAINLWR